MPNFFLSHKRMKVARGLQKSGSHNRSVPPRICGKRAAIQPKVRRISGMELRLGEQNEDL